MNVQMTLEMVRQDEIVCFIGVVLTVCICVMVVCGPYKAEWTNKKKSRVFRERF